MVHPKTGADIVTDCSGKDRLDTTKVDRVTNAIRRTMVIDEHVPSTLDVIRKMAVEGGELELLNKPCHDCAVTTGFYLEYSEAYKEMPPEEQLARSKRWFCHNACNRACRGHANNIGISW